MASKQLSVFVFSALTLILASPLEAQWESVPGASFNSFGGPVGNSVSCLTKLGKYVLAGTDSTGIFYTSDGGNVWRMSGYPHLPIYSMTSLGSRAIACTYDGMYWSNNGPVWTHSKNGYGITMAGPRIAVCNGVAILETKDFGFYRSLDSGQTWAAIDSVVGVRSKLLASDGSRFYSFRADTLRVSEDGGTTWRSLGDSISPGFIASHNNTILVGRSLSNLSSDIYRSSDEGRTWTGIKVTIPSLTNGGEGIGKLEYADGNFFATTSRGVYRSSDDGVTWQATGLHGPDITSLLASDGLLFASSSFGIFKSTDKGATWSACNCGILVGGAYGASFRHLAANPKYVFYGETLVRSSNAGDDWSSASLGLAPQQAWALWASEDQVLAGESCLFRSTDNGLTWDSTDVKRRVNKIVGTGSTVFAATDGTGVMRSANNGISWTKTNEGITSSNVQAICISGQRVFARASDSLYISTDDGNHWAYVSKSLLTELTANTTSLFAIGQERAYRSTDDGRTWQVVWADSGYAAQSIMVIDHNVFVGTHATWAGGFGGLVVSKDNGEHWSDASFGWKDDEPVYSFAIQGDQIFVSTSTGVFRQDLSNLIGAREVNMKGRISRFSIYPNPATTSTTISFIPEASGYADISIVNMLGQTVTTVYSGVLDASEHTFTWEAQAKACAKGMYECVVRMNGKVPTLPIVVQ